MKTPKSKTNKPKQPKNEWTTEPVEGTTSYGPYPPDNSDLKRRIAENPGAVAAEARYKLGEVQAGYRRDLYVVLAMIVGIARHYYFDYKAWKLFFNQPFFQTGKHKPKARTHHTDALRHTMNYVFDAKSKQARSRTGKYAAALHEIMIVGVPVHLVAEEIEREGGIEKLYEAYREREAHKPKKGRKQARTEEEYLATARYCDLNDKKDSEPKDMTLGDLEDGAASAAGQEETGLEDGEEAMLDVSEDGDGSDDGLDIFDEADFGLEPTVERGRDPTGRRTVEIEVTSARQSRFFNMADGQDAVLHVTCRGTEGEWQRLQVRKVIWNRR